MPRTANSKNNNYHFSVHLDDEIMYCRTIKHVAEFLKVGTATIIRKLKTPEITLRKYKNNTLIISRCNIPIYERRQIEY